MPKNETTKSNPTEESPTMTAKVVKEQPKSIERSINSVTTIGNLEQEAYKIEEEFDLDFDPTEIGDMTSVASICAYIKQNS